MCLLIVIVVVTLFEFWNGERRASSIFVVAQRKAAVADLTSRSLSIEDRRRRPRELGCLVVGRETEYRCATTTGIIVVVLVVRSEESRLFRCVLANEKSA